MDSAASAALPVVAICKNSSCCGLLMKEKAKKSKLVPSGSVKHHFEDYCQSTSIHGVKYLGEKDRPLGERLWWLLVFVVCLFGNAYLIGKVWKKWNESPVIVSFAETTTPVWQIPFPAITICSEQKSKPSIFNFTSAFHSNTSDEEIIKMRGDVSLLCDQHVIVEGEDFTNESTVTFLEEVAPTFNDTILITKWKGVSKVADQSEDWFSRTITEEGICYSFNMLSAKELFRGNGIPHYFDHEKSTNGLWTLDGGYPDDAPLENTYPERALFPGTRAGIIVVLNANIEDSDFVCRGPVEGFRVLLHNPAEIPSIGDRYFRVPLSQEIIVGVQPKIMSTSVGLRSYSPQGRQCYFFNERYLRYFHIYTQRNCELECLTNYTLKECGCVALHMPREDDVPLCGAGKKQCMIDASDFLRISEIKSTFRKDSSGSCDCLPACTSLQYDAETSQADLKADRVIIGYGDNVSEISGKAFARLTVFFKDMQFTTSKRSELFGLVDFMANCGGLLGLFCGVSLLSLVEIIYYMTLRFWSNMKNLKEKESQPDNPIMDSFIPDNIRKKFAD